MSEKRQLTSPPLMAPPNFFLFGHVKRKLMEYHTENLSELVVCIRVILLEIPPKTLNAVFPNWVERLQKDIDANGEDVGCVKQIPESKINCARQIRLGDTWGGRHDIGLTASEFVAQVLVSLANQDHHQARDVAQRKLGLHSDNS
jgi:hypothetical protein